MTTMNIHILTTALVLLLHMTSPGDTVGIDSTDIIRFTGTFDVLVVLNFHDKTDGFRCTGPYNSRVAYDVEVLRSAAKSAVQTYLNDINVTIGLTVIDACGSTAVGLRDVAAVLSGKANLSDTGPTIGMLVPGSGSLTAVLVEEISKPLGITTIGYLPTDDIYFDDSKGESNAPNQRTNSDPSAIDSTIFLNQNIVLTTAVSLQCEAMIIANILIDVEWYNVGLLYSEYGTGPSRKEAFLEVASKLGICVSFQHGLPSGITQQISDNIVNKLVDAKEDIKVLVYIVSAEEVQLLARSLQLVSPQFVGIGTASLKDAMEQGLLDDSLLRELDGTIVVDNRIYNESTRFIKLDITNATNVNPWLRKIDMREGSEDNEDNVDIMSSYTRSLNDSMHILAKGLSIACNFSAECTGSTTSPTEIRNAIKTIDGGPRFDQIQVYGISMITKNSFLEVGVLECSSESILIDLDVIVSSVTYRSDGCYCFGDGLKPVYETPFWIYNIQDDPWVTAILIGSPVGILFAGIFIISQLGYCKYPVVQKSVFSMNMFILIGIMFMYSISYFYLRTPTKFICGLQQFGTAFVHSCVYAAMVVKALALRMTLRSGPANISKTEMKRVGIKKTKMSLEAQFFLYLAFIAPQIALSVQWITFMPADVISDPETCTSVTCTISHSDIVLSMIYVFVLVLVTFIVSLLLIFDKRIMHESRSLFISSFCTIMLLAGWTVVFTTADPLYQVPALCLGVTANATILLFAQFTPFCCVLTYGKISRKPLEDEEEIEDKEDDGNAIAYVNPAFINIQSESSYL